MTPEQRHLEAAWATERVIQYWSDQRLCVSSRTDAGAARALERAEQGLTYARAELARHRKLSGGLYIGPAHLDQREDT